MRLRTFSLLLPHPSKAVLCGLNVPLWWIRVRHGWRLGHGYMGCFGGFVWGWRGIEPGFLGYKFITALFFPIIYPAGSGCGGWWRMWNRLAIHRADSCVEVWL